MKKHIHFTSLTTVSEAKEALAELEGRLDKAYDDENQTRIIYYRQRVYQCRKLIERLTAEQGTQTMPDKTYKLPRSWEAVAELSPPEPQPEYEVITNLYKFCKLTGLNTDTYVYPKEFLQALRNAGLKVVREKEFFYVSTHTITPDYGREYDHSRFTDFNDARRCYIVQLSNALAEDLITLDDYNDQLKPVLELTEDDDGYSFQNPVFRVYLKREAVY